MINLASKDFGQEMTRHNLNGFPKTGSFFLRTEKSLKPQLRIPLILKGSHIVWHFRLVSSESVLTGCTLNVSFRSLCKLKFVRSHCHGGNHHHVIVLENVSNAKSAVTYLKTNRCVGCNVNDRILLIGSK